MKFRKGICGDCGAQYKLPETFAADKAKCKQCGGVVAVGPVETAEPPAPAQPKPEPVPAKKPTAAKRPAQAPPKKVAEAGEEAPRKRREGPSMKEQLMARRKAEAAEGEAPAKPAAKKAAPKKAASKPASRKPAGAAKPAAGGSRTTRGSAASGARRGGASSRRGRGGEGEDEGRPARGRRQQKQGNPALLWGSLGAVVIAIAGWFFLMKDDGAQTPGDEATANAPAEAGATDAGTEGATAPEAAGSTEPEAAPAAPSEPEAAAPASEPAPAGDGAAETAAPEETAPEEPEGPATEPPRNAATGRYKVFMLSRQPKTAAKYPDELYDPKDPAEPQIATYAMFETPPGTSPDEWEEIMDLARTMIDPDAGAAGNRAAIALEKKGKPAFPAIVNVMLTLDYSTKDGNQAGDVCQRSLQNIANGRNVGWYHSYREEPNKTAIQNTRCVDLLYNNVWARELREPGYFERYAKIEEKKKADEPAEDDGALDDALDDLDF